MSVIQENKKKKTIIELQKLKDNGEKISVLTAYDYSMAKIMDQAGIDAVIVGDSASNTMLGNHSTLEITMDEMIIFARSVVRACQSAIVIVDMPFGTVAGNPADSLNNAIKIIRETGADAIKIEGGAELREDIKKIIDAGIPVVSHLGLMPQSIKKYGTYNVRGKQEHEAQKMVEDCQLMQQLGVSAIVLEKIPASLAKRITELIAIPTVRIGAGIHTDGQVLVIQDMLGMNKGFEPKYLRQYADVHTVMTKATKDYVMDVKQGKFPTEKESYL